MPFPQILGGKGNNFHDVLTANGEQFVASMPTKFRRNVWIKRGMWDSSLFYCKFGHSLCIDTLWSMPVMIDSECIQSVY